MATGLFMRGQLDLSSSILYYLVARKQGIYYIYQGAPPPVPNPDANAVFASRAYLGGTGWVPRLVSIVPNSNGTYVLRASLTDTGALSNLTATPYKTVLTMDVSSAQSVATQLHLIPEANVGVQALWSGVWYTARTVDGQPVAWKTWGTLNTTGPFAGVSTANPAPIDATSDLQLMFVPRDAGSSTDKIAVWNPVGASTRNKCLFPNETDAVLRMWTDWVLGVTEQLPTNCDGPGWLTSAATGCIFTNAQTCQEGYLYTLCGPEATCGTCLGPCATVGTVTPLCQFDYNPDIKKAGTSPLSCTPEYSEPPTFWELYKTYIIIGIIVAVVLLIFGIVLVASVFHKRPIQYPTYG